MGSLGDLYSGKSPRKPGTVNPADSTYSASEVNGRKMHTMPTLDADKGKWTVALHFHLAKMQSSRECYSNRIQPRQCALRCLLPCPSLREFSFFPLGFCSSLLSPHSDSVRKCDRRGKSEVELLLGATEYMN